MPDGDFKKVVLFTYIESEISEIDEETEVWNEDEEHELLGDNIRESDTEQQSKFQVQSATVEAKALSKWIMRFFLFIKASYKLLNAVVSAFITFLSQFWPV